MDHTLDYKNSPNYSQYKKRHDLKFKFLKIITKEEFKQLSSSECFYCGKSGPNGIDRLDNNIGYVINNCVPCCKHCNYVKGNLSTKLFNSWKERFVKKQMKQYL